MSRIISHIKGILSPEFKTKAKRFLYFTLLGKEPVHFLHISKTGGTALQVALYIHPVTKNYALEFHTHSVKLRDIPQGEKVFFFLRDPATRFVSGFYTRLRHSMPRKYTSWSVGEEKAFEKFDTPNKLALALSSDNPKEKNSAIRAMQSIGHVKMPLMDWFESEEYFNSRLDDIFFVGFQENFSEDFERLKAKLGTPDSIKLPTEDVNTRKTPSDLDTSLDAQSLENIKSWYAKDYDFITLCKRMESNLK